MTVSEMVSEMNRIGTVLKQAVSAVSARVAGVVNAVRLVEAHLEAFSARVATVYDAVGETLGQAQRGLCRAVGLAHRQCQPYRDQIARLREPGVRPLSWAEEWHFMVAGVLMAFPEERGPGRRPALEYVALACGRRDLAAIILLKQRRGLWRRAEAIEASPREREEVPGELYLALYGTVLLSLERRLDDLTHPEARFALETCLSDPYLIASVTHAVNRQRAPMRRQAKLEAIPRQEAAEGQEAEEAEPADGDGRMAEKVDRIALRAAIGAYLRQSSRPELDCRIVEAMGQGISMAKLSRQLEVPERTLRQRRRLLVEHCRRQLELPEQS